jgi:hypothetical protein
MTGNTEGVRSLVEDVLRTIPKPYGEDVTWEVCQAIENNRDWRRRYNELRDELAKDVANNWIGRYTKDLTGLNSIQVVRVPEGHIITSYTKLGR